MRRTLLNTLRCAMHTRSRVTGEHVVVVCTAAAMKGGATWGVMAVRSRMSTWPEVPFRARHRPGSPLGDRTYCRPAQRIRLGDVKAWALCVQSCPASPLSGDLLPPQMHRRLTVNRCCHGATTFRYDCHRRHNFTMPLLTGQTNTLAAFPPRPESKALCDTSRNIQLENARELAKTIIVIDNHMYSDYAARLVCVRVHIGQHAAGQETGGALQQRRPARLPLRRQQRVAHHPAAG